MDTVLDRTRSWLVLVASVSSGIFFDLLLTSPYETLAISDPTNVEAFLLLVVVGTAVTELALWDRRQQARASRSTGYLDGVLSAVEGVASRNPDPEDPDALVRSELTDLLGLDDRHFVSTPLHVASWCSPMAR